MNVTEGPLMAALAALAVAAALFSLRSWILLWRERTHRYRGRHRSPDRR